MYQTPTTLRLSALGHTPTLEAIRQTLGEPWQLDFETRVELRLFVDSATSWSPSARALITEALEPRRVQTPRITLGRPRTRALAIVQEARTLTGSQEIIVGELLDEVFDDEPEIEIDEGLIEAVATDPMTPAFPSTVAARALNALRGSDAPPAIAELHQTALGTCSFLTTLSGLAENDPHALRHLIAGHGHGSLWVRFFRQTPHGETTSEFVHLDGHLPPSGPNGLYAPASFASWIALVEKAHALWKCGAPRGGTALCFELTGTAGSSSAVALTREPASFRRIQAALRRGLSVTAASAPPFLRPTGLQLAGIIGLHAFTVTDAYEREGVPVLRLRNPWGIQPAFVTPRGLIESLGAGQFELTLNEFRAAFPFAYVGG